MYVIFFGQFSDYKRRSRSDDDRSVRSERSSSDRSVRSDGSGRSERSERGSRDWEETPDTGRFSIKDELPTPNIKVKGGKMDTSSIISMINVIRGYSTVNSEFMKNNIILKLEDECYILVSSVIKKTIF